MTSHSGDNGEYRTQIRTRISWPIPKITWDLLRTKPWTDWVSSYFCRNVCPLHGPKPSGSTQAKKNNLKETEEDRKIGLVGYFNKEVTAKGIRLKLVTLLTLHVWLLFPGTVLCSHDVILYLKISLPIFFYLLIKLSRIKQIGTNWPNISQNVRQPYFYTVYRTQNSLLSCIGNIV